MSNIPLENLIRKLKKEIPNSHNTREEDQSKEPSASASKCSSSTGENSPSSSEDDDKNRKRGWGYRKISDDSLLRFATRFSEGDVASKNNLDFPTNIENDENKVGNSVKALKLGDAGSDKSNSYNEDNGCVIDTSQENDHENGENTVAADICSKKNETVVEIDESINSTNSAQISTPSGSLECYLELMHYIGVNPYRREEYNSMNLISRYLLKIIFWIFAISAFTQALRLIKRVGMDVAITRDLKFCVKFGFSLARCFSRYFFIKLLVFLPEKISIMLLHFRKLSMFKTDSSTKHRFSRLAVAMAIGSLVLTMVKAILGYDSFSDWSWFDSLQYRAYHLTESIYAWSPKNHEDETNDLLKTYYWSNITTTHIALGLVDCYLDICETLQGATIRDVLLLAALTTLHTTSVFEKRIESQISSHPNLADPQEVEGCLRHYRILKDANSAMNATINTSLKFVLIQNLLLYAHLFVKVHTNEPLNMVAILEIVDAAKASILLYVGMHICWKNENIKKWLHFMSAYKGVVDVENVLGMTVPSAIADLRDGPIGFGNDYFLINENFLVGVFASVCTIITFLIESGNQSACNKDA